jgi:L-lysine 2,3-aminomutase
MRAACPGYMVPRYVREIEGAPSKTPLGPRVGAVEGD